MHIPHKNTRRPLWTGEGETLAGVDLRKADLCGADLRAADLRGAHLQHTILWGADLRKARLEQADLRCADLTCADLSGANLRESNLTGADLSGARWNAATSWPDGFQPPRRVGWLERMLRCRMAQPARPQLPQPDPASRPRMTALRRFFMPRAARRTL
jgi:hypothetical protein